MPCNSWASGINASQQAFGVTIAGEFSNAVSFPTSVMTFRVRTLPYPMLLLQVNDCGLWVRGVGGEASYGGDCSPWEDASTWDDSVKSGLMQFALSSMDSLQNYFFWTWKVTLLNHSPRLPTYLLVYRSVIRLSRTPYRHHFGHISLASKSVSYLLILELLMELVLHLVFNLLSHSPAPTRLGKLEELVREPLNHLYLPNLARGLHPPWPESLRLTKSH